MLHSCFVFPFLCSLRASSARCRNFPVFTSDSIISSQLFDSYSSYHVLNSLRSFTLSFLICSSISLRFADISLRQLIHIYICDYTTHFMHRKQHILLIFTQYGRIACAPISAITLSSPAFDTRRAFCAECRFAPRVICPREADCYDLVHCAGSSIPLYICPSSKLNLSRLALQSSLNGASCYLFATSGSL